MLPGLSHTYPSCHLLSPLPLAGQAALGRGQQRPATGTSPAALGTSICSPQCCWLLEHSLELAWARVLVSPPQGSALGRTRCLGTLHFIPFVPLPGCWAQGSEAPVLLLGLGPACVSCALTRGHCTTCCSLINNLLTCLAAACSVACFTTLPGVLECWFPWQPDIAFLFFITITVLLLPCSNVLSSLFCLGVHARV